MAAKPAQNDKRLPVTTITTVAYLDQFDDLIRDRDRGKAIRNTRTIAVFTDGLVVCPVSVYGSGKPAGFWRRRSGQPHGRPAESENEVTRLARALGAEGSARELAEGWPKSALLPLAVIEAVELTRPQQVSRLLIRTGKAGGNPADESVFLGNLDADKVREVLGPLLGDRLTVATPAGPAVDGS